MTLRAIEFRPLKNRMVGLMLVEYIEDRPLRRVEGNDLDHLSVVYLTDIDIVVEIQRAGQFRRNLLVLETRLRKNQRLRVDRNRQLLENRFQVPVLRLEIELDLAAVDPFLKESHGVGQVFGAVVDRLLAERDVSLILDGDLAVGGEGKPSGNKHRARDGQLQGKSGFHRASSFIFHDRDSAPVEQTTKLLEISKRGRARQCENVGVYTA
jgi:hypothetical protein